MKNNLIAILATRESFQHHRSEQSRQGAKLPSSRNCHRRVKTNQKCGKWAVRQADTNICTGCAKEHNICAKCCCSVEKIVGRDITEVEAELKSLEDV